MYFVLNRQGVGDVSNAHRLTCLILGGTAPAIVLFMATFVLVHGTYAKSADWPALRDGLTEATHEAGERAHFKQLRWSGKNRTAARQVAASSILKSVQDIQSNSNNEKIFLIGHSHGGSAIAYFLKEYTEAAKMLSGCAFLSTPFVAMRPRNHGGGIASAVLGVPLIVAFLYAMAVWQLGNLYSLLIVVAIFCFEILIQRFYGGHNFLELTVRQQTADVPPGNYFFARCSGDEAAAALSAVQFINWFNMKASKILMWLANQDRANGILGRLGVIFRYVIVYPLLAFGPIIVWLGLRQLGMVGLLKDIGQGMHGTLGEKVEFSLFALSLIAGTFFFVLSLLLAFGIFLMQAVTSRAFGWTSPATGFLVELAIEPLPFGTHSLVHIDWNAELAGRGELTHSWTYAHPVAIRHLQNWVKVSLAAHRARSAENFQPQELQPANAS